MKIRITYRKLNNKIQLSVDTSEDIQIIYNGTFDDENSALNALIQILNASEIDKKDIDIQIFSKEFDNFIYDTPLDFSQDSTRLKFYERLIKN